MIAPSPIGITDGLNIFRTCRCGPAGLSLLRRTLNCRVEETEEPAQGHILGALSKITGEGISEVVTSSTRLSLSQFAVL